MASKMFNSGDRVHVTKSTKTAKRGGRGIARQITKKITKTVIHPIIKVCDKIGLTKIINGKTYFAESCLKGGSKRTRKNKKTKRRRKKSKGKSKK
tara:strand:+ start:477 stop:761 length:285 start_codon:yes stop_codon:yes gene_type:complete